MSYQERKTILEIFSSILIFVIYSLYIYNMHLDGEIDLINNFTHWGLVFVALIPISIVLHIVLHIIFHIIDKIATDEDAPDFEDERDKMIEMKSTRNSHYLFMFGFMLSMGSLAIGWPLHVMFMILIGSGYVSSLFGDFSKLFYYRRGF